MRELDPVLKYRKNKINKSTSSKFVRTHDPHSKYRLHKKDINHNRNIRLLDLYSAFDKEPTDQEIYNKIIRK